MRGTIRNGVALPLEPVKETDEGRKVIITFLDEEAEETTRPNGNNGQVSLKTLIDDFQVDTGIEDLASQHDHYLTVQRRNNLCLTFPLIRWLNITHGLVKI